MDRKGSCSMLMNRYEMGRLLGQGTFAKVYLARRMVSGQSVAIKIIDKQKVMKVGMMDQIKREISVMRLVRHPNVVELYEVMASKAKIYFVMEYVKGGELFNKVSKGKLKEDVARKYFQQLIAAVDFCHSRGVYHRDLKPENLLLDEHGKLKVSDFGLSALGDSRRQDGLLHTTCGTPAYVAPEIIGKKGYHGTKADIWSSGVILFVLLAGYLPFRDPKLVEMYRKISRGDFKCPQWFHPEVRKLIVKVLDPNPSSRISIDRIMENSWFKKGFKPLELHPQDGVAVDSLGDVEASLTLECSERANEAEGAMTMTPTRLNAFDIISLSPGFNLSGLFEEEVPKQPEAWFTTKKPASDIVSMLEEIGQHESFEVMKKYGMVKMKGRKEGRKGQQLAIEARIFEVTPSFHVVELKKSAGDSIEFQKFCDHELKPSLKDIVWTWQGVDLQQHLA